jgi:type IX secretion system PorP/SprF family membrane protein
MKKIIIPSSLIVAIVFLSFGFQLFSQQLPQYTQWSSHQFAINPAHAGIKPCLDVHSLFRTQWQGFEGAPKSGFLTLSVPINAKVKHWLSARYGIGAKVELDNIGPFTSNRLNVSYAAHFNFSPDTRLSLGLYGGFIQYGYNAQGSTTINPDPSVLKSNSFIKPDATFGAWWNGKNYYLGMVLQNLITSKWEDIGSDSKFRIHTLFNGGYRYALNKQVTCLPGFIMRIPPKGPISMDLNLLFDYQNKIALGVGYRNTDAFIVLLNLKIKSQLSLQYSFDLVLSPLRKGTVNSHEISLTYSTCKSKNTKSTACSLFE